MLIISPEIDYSKETVIMADVLISLTLVVLIHHF